ncbi:MAG: flagellar biosynthetic protein FliR [Gemmatimonadales bacterium]
MTAAVAALNPFAPGSAETLALFGTRIGGMVLVAPAYSAAIVPRSVRVGILIVFTLLLQPAALASVRGVPALTPTAFLSEAMLGLAIGLGAALLVGAAEAAGDVMAVQMGLSGSAILDPLDTTSVPVLGTFTRLFATVLLLSLNLHTVMLGALADSAAAFPVGTPVSLMGGAGAMLQMGGTLFSYGVRFAAPVIAAVFIANVALAVLGRAAPQLNILTVAFPLQIAIGLLALVAALPSIGRFFSGWSGVYDGLLSHAVRGFAVAPVH